MTQSSLDSLLMGYQHLRHIGENILLAGLVGELLVSAFLHERKRAERVGTVVCTAAIIAGVWIENVAGGRADEVIERMRAPRSLSTEQQEKIAAKLRQFAGQSFNIITFPSDKDGGGLAVKIKGALILAAWVEHPVSEWLGVRLIAGVEVALDPGRADDLRKAADDLVSSLIGEGINAEVEVDPEQGTHPNDIQIRVGVRP